MKKTLFFLFILTYHFVFGQQNDFPFLAKPDEILRKTEMGYIYTSTDTTSRIYEWMAAYEEDLKLLNEYYQDYLDETADSAYQLSFKPSFLNQAWVPLVNYKEKPFLYSPSDYMAFHQWYFSESALFQIQTDGSFFPYTNAQQVSDSSWEIEFYNPYLEQLNYLTVSLIEQHPELLHFVIEDHEHNEWDQFTAVSTAFLKQYPVIVNDCGMQKCFMEPLNEFK